MKNTSSFIKSKRLAYLHQRNLDLARNHKRDILMFAAIGIVVAVIYVIVANLLDNTVKDAKDIELATGLPVLAEIPLCDFSNARGRKK